MKVDELLNRKVLKRADLQAHRDFLMDCLEENQEQFRRLLYELGEVDPKAYLRMILDIHKSLVPKQQDVNLTMTFNKDFQELQALSKSEVVEYEEIYEAEKLALPKASEESR